MTGLALGTVQFGLPYGIANRQGQVAPAAVADILAMARAGGIDTLDTAAAYGDSEARLGAAGVGGFRIVTKLPPMPAGATPADWLRDQLDQSLERLGVVRLHGLLLHRADDLLGPAGADIFAALQAVQAQGKVAKIGVSIYDPAVLAPIMERFPADLVQAPFSIIDQRLLRSGWLARLHGAGVEVHSRSAFLQGLLLMARGDIPACFGRWSALWDAWYQWLAQTNITAVQAALGFALSQPMISRVVFGVDDAGQLDEILRAARARAQPQALLDWPDLACDDADLVNPSNWGTA